MGASRIAGRYELQEELGEGGMGVVWRALDVKTGSAVAIKLMKDISDPVAVELFTKEWKALAEISHPNIVEVRDVDVIEENRQKKPFFVMPLLRGSTLADLIANASARLTLERIVEITTHVCRGLQAAHQRGLVHRDLKPSNIFVMDDDSAKIIDFGVVHLAGSKSITGQKGTFQYMSPEQAQLKEITPSSDLFSMGVILYEALTRRKPFARKTAEETMDAVINYIPPPVSELHPNINQNVSKVVHKCLAKKPIHRFASAKDLADALQKAARNEPVFDSSKIEPRIERAKTAYKNGDEIFASEILAELESEGHLDPRITVLRMQIDVTVKQKKIRQLLESAHARMEQDEIPLALDKVREVLELDAQNPDALAMREAMEKQRNEKQIAKWLELAQTHLSNRDFGAARNAAQEVLAIRAADSRAMDLLEKIESTEADARRVREQKEQLYSSAMRAYQNGEIDSALGKLERLFSVARANPNAAIPERDAVYQSFYNEVRSERETIHSSFEDAQRQFSEKNFAGAMAICRQLLAKYPNDGTFQALKIHIEDAERQELSSYIAEVSKRLEGEPDLDKRVNVLRDASERYPNETQFAQQLKSIRERRDLVNSIVAKAHQYDERGQYAEAISQWDILRNIHPQYAGLAFEMEQCRKKRERQAHEEEHSRLIEEIDALIEDRAFSKAMECADAALAEFPGDTELSGLRTLAEQGLERTKESRRLYEMGQQALAEKDLVQATDLLRKSYDLDPRAPGLRDAVVTVLTERARGLAEENWREAEPLYQQASEIDATHPAVRALRSSISEGKRHNFVGQYLTECRALVASGRPEEAAEKIRAARAEYPNDPRLERFQVELLKDLNEFRRREERGRDRAVLGENRRLAEQNPNRENLVSVLEKSYAIRDKYADDAEIAETIADIEVSVKRAAKVEDLSELLSLKTVMTGTDGRAVGSRPVGSLASVREGKKRPKLVGKNDEKTKIFEAPKQERKPSPVLVFLKDAENVVKVLGAKAVALARPAGKLSSTTLLVISSAIVLVAAGTYVILRPHAPSQPNKPEVPASIHIATDPADSSVTSNGSPITNGMALAGATIEVSHLGYKTKLVEIQQATDGKIVLEPEPVRISIHTSEPAGSVTLDDKSVGELSDGNLEVDGPADAGTHKLNVIAPGKTLFAVAIRTSIGGQPSVATLQSKDIFVVTALGDHATLYATDQLKSVRIGDQSINVSPSGAAITLTDQNRQLDFVNGKENGSFAIPKSNAPFLALQSLNADGQLLITTTAENAVLMVDGIPAPRGKRGWTISKAPGVAHKFVLSAEGYDSESWSYVFLRGQTLSKLVELHAKPSQPQLAGLLITECTPEAEIAVDGQNKGRLDATGGQHFPAFLAPGKHTIKFSKFGFETLSREIEIDAGQPGKSLWDRTVSKVVLALSVATLSFEVPSQLSAKDVNVTLRRVDESRVQATNAAKELQLQPGQYEIQAEAPGYQKFTDKVSLQAGSKIRVPLNLMPIPDYVFENPSQVAHEDKWLKSTVSGKFVNLKPGLLHEELVFYHPGKTLFWNKKAEWQVEDPARRARILYSLEGQGKFSRKLVVGDETSNQISGKKVDAQATGQESSFSVHVSIDGTRVRITNDKGEILDEFSALDQDFSKGRIGIRTESPFIVRSDNQ